MTDTIQNFHLLIAAAGDLFFPERREEVANLIIIISCKDWRAKVAICYQLLCTEI